jgi:hypothetical protein
MAAPFRAAAMQGNFRTWLPQVGLCLLLQGTIVGGGLLLNRWILPEPPCCDSPLVL